MIKKLTPLFLHTFISLCTFSLVYRMDICIMIFHDNIPPDNLEQWLLQKRKHYD